jgi:hypothetical protein
MKSILMLVALAALNASSAPRPSARESLMNEIEGQVRLPAEAEPLSAYGRYYAFGGKGKVEARYLLPLGSTSPLPADSSCEEMVIVGDDIGAREVPCTPPADRSRFLKAGQRRWYSNPEAIPMIFDGGCMVVHVTFDLKTRKVEHIYCNGYA